MKLFGRIKSSLKGISRDKIKDWVEVVKNIAEILAICAAGLWAYYTFVVRDKPGLEHRIKIASEVNWDEVGGKDICGASYKVSLENIGTTAFNISKARLRAWQFPAIVLGEQESTKYVDVNDIQKRSPFLESIYNSPSNNVIEKPFLGHYPPGAVWTNSFDFIIKRDPNTWVLFMLEVYEKGDDNADALADATYSWDVICGTEKQNEQRSDNQTGR